MIKTVIYDADGTVIDSLSTIAEYANQTLSHFGLKTYSESEYRYFVGNGAAKLIEKLIVNAGVSLDDYYEKVHTYYNKIYDASPIGCTKPYDGISEVITAFKHMGIKQAVLSNKPDTAVKGVVGHFFKDEFDCICGAREKIPLKPDPQALISILDGMNVKADECLYVGDTYVDILTGRSAGAHTVGVLWGFRERSELENNGAEFIISHPRELIEIVTFLNS